MEGVTRVALGARPSDGSWTARAALAHPAWWAAALLLLLNDHYLKGGGVLAPWLTGKLSDFAGLLMAPVVVAAVVAPRSRRAFRLAHVAVGGVFTLLKLSPACASAWCSLGGALGMTWRVVSDSTDLLALPMLLLSLRLFGSRWQPSRVLQAWQRVLATFGGGVGLFGIVATSRLPPQSPVVTPKSVFVPTGDELQALDRSSGKWQRSLDCEVGWSTPQLLDDTLFAGGRKVQACNLERGGVAWTHELDESSEIIYADTQRVIAQTSGSVWALAPRSGAVIWRVEQPNLRAVASAGKVTIQGLDGSFSAFSLSDGLPLRSSETNLGSSSMEWFGKRRPVQRYSSAIGSGQPPDVVFLFDDGMSCKDGRLAAWRFDMAQKLWSIPWCPWDAAAAADDTLLVTVEQVAIDLQVTARESRTGRVLWHTMVDD